MHTDYMLLKEQTKRDALRLRREASVAFWAALGDALHRGLQRAASFIAPSSAVPRAPTAPSARPRARAASSA
jgi:hypothetical protein